MIYRILVDHRQHTKRIRVVYVLTRYHMEIFSRSSDADLLLRLSPTVDKVFPDYESFALVLAKILGKSNLERFARQLIHMVATSSSGNDLRVAVPWQYEEERRLVGPGYGHLADVMQDHGLRVPSTTNPRLRYYFTEAGWRIVGRHVAAEARRLGHHVKVICQKNPAASQVAYRDEFQMAILQKRRPLHNTTL
jgi:hypothetical protein